MSINDTIMDQLVKISGTEDIRTNPDVALFGEGYLDSLGLVELIVTLAEIFKINLSPSQVSRDTWATPRKIIEDINKRLKASPDVKS